MFKKTKLKTGQTELKGAPDSKYEMVRATIPDTPNAQSLAPESPAITHLAKPLVGVKEADKGKLFLARFGASVLDGIGVAAAAVPLALTLQLISRAQGWGDAESFSLIPIISSCLILGLLECITGGASIAIVLIGFLFPFVGLHVPAFNLLVDMNWIEGAISVLVSSFVYHVLFEWLGGSTPGKATVGLSITTADGSRPGFGRALLRQCSRIVGVLTLSIPIIPMALSNSEQFVHDRIAGCFVRRQKNGVTSGASNSESIASSLNNPQANFATIKQRIISAGIDALLCFAIESILCLISQTCVALYLPQPQVAWGWTTLLIAAAMLVPSIAGAVLVMALCESSPMHATPGKAIVGTSGC